MNGQAWGLSEVQRTCWELVREFRNNVNDQLRHGRLGIPQRKLTIAARFAGRKFLF